MALRVGGIVLCGGHSKRMGQPKAWLPFAGELMLPRIVRLLRLAVEPVVVVAAPVQDLPSLPAEVQVVRDARPDRGPLEGLAAGLHMLAGHADAAFVSSCDVPLFQPGFVRRMIELLGDNQVCVPFVDGFHHPLAAVYRIEVVDAVERLLAADRLGPKFLFGTVSTRLIGADDLRNVDPDLRTLRNVNTPEDYAAAIDAVTYGSRDLNPG